MKALAPVRTAAPAEALLSLEEAKAHLRVDGVDENALIARLVAAATAQLDGHAGVLGQALLAQTWSQSFDGFPCPRVLRLPVGPLIEVTELTYFDADGEVQVFSAFAAVSDAIGPKLVLEEGACWPATAVRPDAVTVTWTCGRASAEDPNFPGGVIQAVKLMIEHWYSNRGAVVTGTIATEMPLAVAWLLGPHRRIGV